MFNFFKHITVEPSLFIFIIVHEWMSGLDTNLFLQKTCRFNQTTEPDLSTKCDDERGGVLFITEINSKYKFVVGVLSAIVTILGSSWSDKAGRRRRPLIYIAILGQIIQTLMGCLNSYFWQWTVTVAIISWVILDSISGNILLMLFSSHVYVCDISNVENRTMKLGLLGAARSMGLILGRGGSGFILHRFGFYYSYLISFAMSVFGLMLGIIFIKDTSVYVEQKIGFRQMFNLKHVILDSFRVVFNKKLGRKRITVSLLFVVNITVIFTFFGELSVTYQYLRYRFGFNEADYSNYLFYRFCGSSLGVLFCTIVLSKLFKIHDGLIGIFAGIFDTLAIVALLFANQIWQIYFIPLIDLFHGTALIICLSFISKYYDPNELGRFQAVNGIFSLLIPLGFPAYNIIYEKTLDSFPSAFCLLSVVLDLLIVVCYWISYICSKKFDKETPKEVEEESCDMIAPSGKCISSL